MKNKIIGTFVPISALSSLQVDKKDQGTFATGMHFLDWLVKTKQSAWQLLPLYEPQLQAGSSTKHVPSPYKSYSIGLDPRYLTTAFAKKRPTIKQIYDFLETHAEWIYDFALFCSLRDHFKTDNWRLWDEDIRTRDKEALARWTKKLQMKIDDYVLIQWQLHEAYSELRKKAEESGISLVGDLPYYPSVQSPLVWAYQDAFQIEKDGSLKYVSGIPNSEGSHFGRQVWGHPLYNWEQQEKVIKFWEMRLRYQTTLFNDIRFDHAKAFFSYGVIDIADENKDRYEAGPGEDVFKHLITYSRENGLIVFAEDSGDRTDILRDILEEFDVPGIKIFRFGLKKGKIEPKYAEVSTYPKNCLAYTTTHDTETLLGYLEIVPTEQKQQLAEAAEIAYDPDDKIFATRIRNAILTSPASTVIIPIQDWLLTTDRINIPGTEKAVNDSNWHFQLKLPIESLPTNFN